MIELSCPTVTNKKAALIDSNNTVVNVIVWDDENHTAPDGLTPIVLSADHSVSIGWIYDHQSNTFNNPNPIIIEHHTKVTSTVEDLQKQVADLQQKLQELLNK